MRALSSRWRATKKCTAKFDRRDRSCMLRTLRDLQTEDFSEGPSDCHRAVLRISQSLLSFAGRIPPASNHYHCFYTGPPIPETVSAGAIHRRPILPRSIPLPAQLLVTHQQDARGAREKI